MILPRPPSPDFRVPLYPRSTCYNHVFDRCSGNSPGSDPPASFPRSPAPFQFLQGRGCQPREGSEEGPRALCMTFSKPLDLNMTFKLIFALIGPSRCDVWCFSARRLVNISLSLRPTPDYSRKRRYGRFLAIQTHRSPTGYICHNISFQAQ